MLKQFSQGQIESPRVFQPHLTSPISYRGGSAKNNLHTKQQHSSRGSPSTEVTPQTLPRAQKQQQQQWQQPQHHHHPYNSTHQRQNTPRQMASPGVMSSPSANSTSVYLIDEQPVVKESKSHQTLSHRRQKIPPIRGFPPPQLNLPIEQFNIPQDTHGFTLAHSSSRSIPELSGGGNSTSKSIKGKREFIIPSTFSTTTINEDPSSYFPSSHFTRPQTSSITAASPRGGSSAIRSSLGLSSRPINVVIKQLDYLSNKGHILESLDVFCEFIRAQPFNETLQRSASIVEKQRVFEYAIKFHSLSVAKTFKINLAELHFFDQPSAVYFGNISFHTASTIAGSNASSIHNSDRQATIGEKVMTMCGGDDVDSTISVSNMTTSRRIRMLNNTTQRDYLRTIEQLEECMEKLFLSPHSNLSYSHRINYINELAVLSFRRHDYTLGIQQFETLASMIINETNDEKGIAVSPIILNNTAVAMLLMEDMRTAWKLLETSIQKSEESIFPTIKSIEKEYLKSDPEFLAALLPLVSGYLYAEVIQSSRRLAGDQHLPMHQSQSPQQPRSPPHQNSMHSFQHPPLAYARNAMQITKKYFGNAHPFTKKVITIATIIDVSSTSQACIRSINEFAEDQNTVTISTASAITATASHSPTTAAAAASLIQTCVMEILKECGISVNAQSVISLMRHRRFKDLLNQSVSSSSVKIPSSSTISNQLGSFNSTTGVFNQSSTRVSTEPSTQNIRKRDFQLTGSNMSNASNQQIPIQQDRGNYKDNILTSSSEMGKETMLLTDMSGQKDFTEKYEEAITTQEVEEKIQADATFIDGRRKDNHSSVGRSAKPGTSTKGRTTTQAVDVTEVRRTIQELTMQNTVKNQGERKSTIEVAAGLQGQVRKQEEQTNEEESLRSMLVSVIESNEKFKKEKLNNGQEIVQMQRMMSELMESQKNNAQQLKQQQKQLLETQVRQVEQLKKLSGNGSQGVAEDEKLKKTHLQKQNSFDVSRLQKVIEKSSATQNSLALTKQVFVEGEKYSVTSQLFVSGELVISVMLTSTSKQLAKEIIAKEQLKQLLSEVSYQKTMPTTLSPSMCQTIYHVNKYFILPFAAYDFKKKEIKFTKTASGLLSKVYERQFLGEKVTQTLHSIEGGILRLVLSRRSGQYSSSEQPSHLKIDIELDSGSMKLWMEVITPENEYSKEEMRSIDDLTKLSSNRNVQLQEMQQRSLKEMTPNELQSLSKSLLNRSFQIRSYRILNEPQLMQELDDMLNQLDEFLQSPLNTHNSQPKSSTYPTLSSFLATTHFLRFKVWSIGQKRQLQLSIDDPSSSLINVTLKNNYLTFVPGGQKLKAVGLSTFSYKQIFGTYGIAYSDITTEEKSIFLSQIPDFFALNVHEKNDDNLAHAKSSKYPENHITRLPPVSGGFVRIMKKQPSTGSSANYISPLTFEIIGTATKLLGVRVLLFDSTRAEETGIFLTIEDAHWSFENKILLKNSFHLYLESLPLTQFFLPHIFENIVVPLLKNNVIDLTDPNKLRIKDASPIAKIARIENFVSLPIILQHFHAILTDDNNQ